MEGGREFLGFMVTYRGIEVNPEKAQIILDMQPPKSIKDIQSLNGEASLPSRFMSKLEERLMSFFQVMK